MFLLLCMPFRMQECCHFISQAKWIQATYLENQHGVCSVFKSQQLFLYGAGCFKVSTLNFNSRFKFSINVFTFQPSQKVSEYKSRGNEDAWDFCRGYEPLCMWQHTVSLLSVNIQWLLLTISDCFLQLANRMAHGTCKLPELLIKEQPRDLSLITGAAEDWGKVIKGSTAPAVPWQETDQTNLCSFSCKINVQVKMLFLSRLASTKWPWVILLVSVCYLLLLSYVLFPTVQFYQVSPGMCLSSWWLPLLPVLLIVLSLLFVSFYDPLTTIILQWAPALTCGHWPLYSTGSHPLGRGEFIKPGHTHSVAIRGWAISIPKMYDVKNSLVVS